VRIRSAEEIFATLDEEGTLGGLPFMPEMVGLCGTTAVVERSAHKTCDTQGMRRLRRTVHLKGVACDGSAHGGCQLRCRTFWRTEWLEPARRGGHAKPLDAGTRALAARALKSSRLHGRSPSHGTYSCQATELPLVTTSLPCWHPMQYVLDVLSGNVTVTTLLRALPAIVFNGYQDVARRILPPQLWLRRGRYIPSVLGRRTKTPSDRIGLQPGNHVMIKSFPEITDTLDTTGANRGLMFDWEMISACGKAAVVERRVERLIDERTGRLKMLDQATVVLEGIACTGRFHRFCSRGQDSLWREIWLRVPGRGGSDTA
jgi:hypothetical protein